MSLLQKTMFGICFVLFGRLDSVEAAGSRIFQLNTVDESQSLGQYIDILIDDSRALSIEDISRQDIQHQFKPSIESTPNFGRTEAAIWLRFNIQNQTQREKGWTLGLNRALFDTIKFYTPKNEFEYLEKTTGRFFPYSQRDINHPSFSFALDIPTGKTLTYHVRLTTADAFNIPITIATSEVHARNDGNTDLVFGLYFGVILAMIFYNLSMYLFTDDKNYLFYILSTLFLHLFFQMSELGYTYRFLWPKSPWIEVTFHNFSAIFGIMWCNVFSYSFLRMANFSKLLARTSQASIIVGAIVSCVAPFLSYGFTWIFMTVYGVFSILQISISAGIIMAKGYKPARYFLLAWSGFFFGALMTMMMANGYLPRNIFTRYGFQFGSALEVALLSIALSYRISSERKQAETDRQKIYKNREHILIETSKVLYEHQINKIAKGMGLEDTMPQDQSTACVLCLDIIESSKLKQQVAKEFLRDVFAKCNITMQQGYDQVNLKARAYRIKEMGDGFLCSVGYPFESLSDNLSNEAVRLAESFLVAVDESTEKFALEDSVLASVGIAFGEIAGFYPATGAKEYDVYGRSIVLSTRYEAMRKALFSDPLKSHIIILHENVFSSLSQEFKDNFILSNLSKSGKVVRDDTGADKLFYTLRQPTISCKADDPDPLKISIRKAFGTI